MDDPVFEEVLASDVITSLNLDMFDETDILNVVLQRSNILYDIPNSGRLVRSWTRGAFEPLRETIAQMGHDLVRRAIAFNYIEYQSLKAHLDAKAIKSVADIGCGYGFIDLFIHRDLGAHLTLIDIEESAFKRFGYGSEGAGYSNLRKVASFLQGNGVPAQSMTTINPNKSDLMKTVQVDVALSLLSCGFHYPVDTYSEYFATKVNAGGTVILDLREGKADEQAAPISKFGTVMTHHEVSRGAVRTYIRKN